MQFVLEIYDRKARYMATQANYQNLVNRYGKDKNGKNRIQLKNVESAINKDIESAK
jgi:hypothetical protein